jgi:cob(I)alamin adenosyltransferase
MCGAGVGEDGTTRAVREAGGTPARPRHCNGNETPSLATGRAGGREGRGSRRPEVRRRPRTPSQEGPSREGRAARASLRSPETSRTAPPGLFRAEGTVRRAQLHLYYGEGKGKTTAAFGQAVRAWGRGWRVLFVQFLKDARAGSGEAVAAVALGPRFRLLRVPQPAPVLGDPGPGGKKKLRAACGGLLGMAAAEIARRSFDVIVLDEALVACHFRFLAAAPVLSLWRSAAGRGVRLVILTGRWAPAGLLRHADLATEMRKVKHPFDRGDKAVHGIDF